MLCGWFPSIELSQESAELKVSSSALASLGGKMLCARGRQRATCLERVKPKDLGVICVPRNGDVVSASSFSRKLLFVHSTMLRNRPCHLVLRNSLGHRLTKDGCCGCLCLTCMKVLQSIGLQCLHVCFQTV